MATTTTAYCIRCKKKKGMKNVKSMSKNGRKYKCGICSTCGMKMVRLGA